MNFTIKYLAFILLTVAINSLSAQTDTLANKIVTDKFVENYNKDSYKEIFLMFSTEMQQALPIDKTIVYMTDLKSDVGNIISRDFIRFEKGTSASYKTKFEKETLSLNISIDKYSKINGFYILPFEDLPVIVRNTTKLNLPFKGEWTTTWGGDTKELNYHVESRAQKNAFDFLILNENGKSYKTDGSTNEDYYAFGKELIAPCDGEIVLVVDGVKDNEPGVLNPIYVPGNTVILKTDSKEYLFFAHFKQHSIKVKQGQRIKQGELLGLCGNSGNSSEPHLHYHIQNVEDMNIATGVKCYFNELYVNGELKVDYSPIKKDKIKLKE